MEAERGKLLLQIARASIHDAVGASGPRPSDAEWLREPGATFVTLMRAHRLRGCIGSIEAHRPIGEDVKHNAVSAAMRDPRFSPMARNELFDLQVEVTLLSALEPLEVKDEADALAKLRPGVDGLLLSYRGHRGTFLPQMWERLPKPATFMKYLKEKAGLPHGFWHADVRLQRYTVEKWEDDAPTQA